MVKIKPLDYKHLRNKINPSKLGVTNAKEIKLLHKFVGQERAIAAINFGINIKSPGYHLYAMGPIGVGKRAIVTSVLQEYAKRLPIPYDWCYIHNFDVPEQPIAIKLPPGIGIQLQKKMKILIGDLTSTIVAVFESDEYQLGIKEITLYFNNKRKRLRKIINNNDSLDETPYIYRRQHIKEKELQVRLVSSAIKPLITKIKKKFHKYKVLINYFENVQKDILENVSDFTSKSENNTITLSLENPLLTKYKVNLLVDNSKLKSAPIIFQESPSYSTLFCRIEYTLQLGVLVTNFTLIKPGDLHHANGGFLLIEARKLKKDREAWEALKSALYSQKIKLKPIAHESDPVKPISLEPKPIPLNIKVILLGDRNTYYSLCQSDPDFIDLFKVAVDFNEEIKLNEKNIKLYAKLIAFFIKRNNLHPFHSSAVAAIIEHGARLAEDAEKLTTHIREIENLAQEAHYWANLDGKQLVTAEYVNKAIDTKIKRLDRAKEVYYQDIHRNFIIINTKGNALGQVNCLSVRRVGSFSYGHPTRVTARIRIGNGKFIDIQRESDMAGSLHTKAGLIIANFLASRFNQDILFSLHASISFEQIYCWTDGDSASVGELCALLSALANVPIHQYLAITGSVDQYGNIQAVGGINEKIEGFYDICKSRNLTKSQGVIIPAVNVKNLMLRNDILEAARLKKFFIYPINSIDEAITLLTSVPAGERNAQGLFPKESIYYRIEQQLLKFSRNRIRKIKRI